MNRKESDIIPEIDKESYRELYILGILTFLLMFSVTLIYPVMEDFVMERFDVTSIAETSLFVSINLAAYVIFSLIWGSISDKMGIRKIFIFTGFLGNALLMFSLTLATTMSALLTLRSIEGAFTAMAFSLIMTSVLDLVKKTTLWQGHGNTWPGNGIR